MKILVVGGRLQGVEVTYLAKQAGYEAILVDKVQDVPAVGLCDHFHQLDVVEETGKFRDLVQSVQLIVPAVENKETLACLVKLAMEVGIPLAFDSNSYELSCSKRESDRLFGKIGIPAPCYWPNVGMPVVVKPSHLSGSQGVRKITSTRELNEFVKTIDPTEWVIQEYLEGPSYSLEVMGLKGLYVTFQITELFMDEAYDCRRVTAPVYLHPETEREFVGLASAIAKAINLTGLMDVEVIYHQGQLKVLEIDARFPSQTPITVYKSTGVNLLTHLSELYVNGRLPEVPRNTRAKAVSYEHIRVDGQEITSLGEHIMADAGPLSYCENFYGADEALTNYRPGCSTWVATFIFVAEDEEQVKLKRKQTLARIRQGGDLNE